MSKKKKNTKPHTNYEVYRSIRKDWGELNPVTRIIPDKRNKKPKHKERYEEVWRKNKHFLRQFLS